MFNIYVRRNSEVAVQVAAKAASEDVNAKVVGAEASAGDAIAACVNSVAERMEAVRLEADHINVTLSPEVIESPEESRALLSLIKQYCACGVSNVHFSVSASKA